MIPISIVSLINSYKEEETLKSTREWFLDALKSNLVLDSDLAYDPNFYRLLEDDSYLGGVFTQIDVPQGTSYAEAVLACTEFLKGTYLSSAQIKEKILVMDDFSVLLNYLRWSWFRAWLDSDLKLLQTLKERIASVKPALRFVFIGSVPVRRHVYVAENAKFAEWYLSNFFIGHPSWYCDLNLFVDYASSHYQLEALKNYGQSPNYEKLSEPGALVEAIKNGKIKQLETHHFSALGLEQLASGFAQAMRVFEFFKEELRYLIRLFLRKQIPINSQVYLDFILRQVTTLQDYTLQDFDLSQRTYLLAFLLLNIPKLEIEWDRYVLKKLKSTLESLFFSLTTNEEKRLFNGVVRILLVKFVLFLVSLSQRDLNGFFEDGLVAWFLRLLELDILYLPTLKEIFNRHDPGRRLGNLDSSLDSAISTSFGDEPSAQEMHAWELVFFG